MRNLVGLEMVCFAKSKHFTLDYAGGGYVDMKGEPVEDVMDMACYACSTSYFTRSSDPVEYCPNCGHIDRKRFGQMEDLRDYLLGTDFTWTKKNGTKPVMVQTWEGDWQLRFTRNAPQLEASGQYKGVRDL